MVILALLKLYLIAGVISLLDLLLSGRLAFPKPSPRRARRWITVVIMMILVVLLWPRVVLAAISDGMGS